VAGERLAARIANDFSALINDEADMLLLCQSSESLPQAPDRSVDLVVTDPPFANVMYSELSDYFYVWLRRALGDTYPQLFGRPFVMKRTLVSHSPSTTAERSLGSQSKTSWYEPASWLSVTGQYSLKWRQAHTYRARLAQLATLTSFSFAAELRTSWPRPRRSP